MHRRTGKLFRWTMCAHRDVPPATSFRADLPAADPTPVEEPLSEADDLEADDPARAPLDEAVHEPSVPKGFLSLYQLKPEYFLIVIVGLACSTSVEQGTTSVVHS